MTLSVKRMMTVAAAGVLTVFPLAISATPAEASTINCVYSGPVVDHPGMQYICYVHHDDGSMEIFYAPGPAANP
jgi:hypothetical protein